MVTLVFFALVILFYNSEFSCFGYDPGGPTQFQHTREKRNKQVPLTNLRLQTI